MSSEPLTPIPTPLLGPEHPQRLTLAGEVHARPPQALETPSRATFVAVLIDPSDRDREADHLAALCKGFAVEPPEHGSNHFAAQLGRVALTWERHGEFSSYTFGLTGLSPQPFSEPPAHALPPGWLAAVPGRVIAAAHAKLVAAAQVEVDAALLARHFDGNIVCGGELGDGAGAAYSDFRIHADGFSRFLLVDHAFTARQAGRMLQRLFDIEAYRMMALLALPVARRQAAQLVEIEAALSAATAHIASGSDDDEVLLHEVTRLAAEVESTIAASQFRHGACRAYAEIVATRIDELRERRTPGIQPIGEFMARRFNPAVATCATIAQRLNGVSERVARAGSLLSTRVAIARERQSQELLASMDRRAKLQLRLQQTVEGLSVAAIVYYAAGLVGYVAKGLHGAGARINADLVIGASIPLLAILVIAATRRARRRMEHDEHGGSDR